MLFVAGTLSIVAFIVSIAAGEGAAGSTSRWYNLYAGLAFFAVAFINAGLEFYQEARSAVLIGSLKQLVPAGVRVRRCGGEQSVSSAEVVCGDLVLIERGSKIPADLRILEVFFLITLYIGIPGFAVGHEWSDGRVGGGSAGCCGEEGGGVEGSHKHCL